MKISNHPSRYPFVHKSSLLPNLTLYMFLSLNTQTKLHKHELSELHFPKQLTIYEQGVTSCLLLLFLPLELRRKRGSTDLNLLGLNLHFLRSSISHSFKNVNNTTTKRAYAHTSNQSTKKQKKENNYRSKQHKQEGLNHF